MRAILYLALSLFLAGSAAQAATFSGTAVGNWTNPQASFGYGIFNYDQGNAFYDQSYAVWGQTANCSSCTTFNNFWAFDGVGSDGDPAWSAADNTLFHFGDLSYRNGSVYGHDFTGADLSVSLQILSPLNTIATFDFSIEVENVPNNTGNPVTDGDIAKIVGGIAPQFFSFNGVDYTMTLLGFSRDGGATLASEFQVAEATTDTVGLYGMIVPVANLTVVPLPASLSLMVLGLGALGLRGRRRQTL